MADGDGVYNRRTTGNSGRYGGTAPIERVDVFRGSGQGIRARNRPVRWDGGGSLDQGKILSATDYAFDSASEGIEEISERAVSWKSVTTGDADGVILQPPVTVLSFNTPVIQHAVSLAEIAGRPIAVEAGGIDIKVVFEHQPLGIERYVEFSFRESEHQQGAIPAGYGWYRRTVPRHGPVRFTL